MGADGVGRHQPQGGDFSQCAVCIRVTRARSRMGTAWVLLPCSLRPYIAVRYPHFATSRRWQLLHFCTSIEVQVGETPREGGSLWSASHHPNRGTSSRIRQMSEKVCADCETDRTAPESSGLQPSSSSGHGDSESPASAALDPQPAGAASTKTTEDVMDPRTFIKPDLDSEVRVVIEYCNRW